MIPGSSGVLDRGFEVREQPTRTWRLAEERMAGSTDGQDAMRQAVFKILNTERYRYIIYTWNYGVELDDLCGQPVSYVCSEAERRITEALTWDSRITGVSDFEFDISCKEKIAVSFLVHTVFGDIPVNKEVKV